MRGEDRRLGEPRASVKRGGPPSPYPLPHGERENNSGVLQRTVIRYSPMKRWMKVTLGSVGTILAFGLWFTYYIGLLDHNFRVIAPNKAYRSAQLPPALLEREV